MLDQDDVLFTVTDLKQYMYCPRIAYYQVCLPDIRPTTYKMQAGIDAHNAEPGRAKRRSLALFGGPESQRQFDVTVLSQTRRLSGQIDEVVVTESEHIPVDYKLARKAAHNYKIQLAAYALLLEDDRDIRVKRGYLYLIPIRKLVEVAITSKLRQQVHQAIDAMQEMLATERMPVATDWRQRCADCEFRRFCNDV